MSDGMRRELVYLSSYATNRYFIPNWGIWLYGNMLATFNSMLVSSLEPLTSTLTDRQQEILNESGYSDLMRNSNSIINCAMLLSLGYIREATTYAESCCGGS